jgi:fatty acid desaturase
MARAWQQALSREEIKSLLETDNWRSFGSIALNWGLVAASFAWVAWAPGIVSILGAIAVIGGRQLGFAVLMHEAAHHTLFRNRRLNDLAGNWLCAYPVWTDIGPYRAYHLQHHAKNWTSEDPDLDLATKYPVTRDSMKRKVWRDLSGQVGWKRARATLRRDLGLGLADNAAGTSLSFGKTARKGGRGWQNLRGVVISNGVLLVLLSLVGRPELYLLWVVAWFTTNSLVTRIRSIAEHNMATEPGNPLKDSRTIETNWWQRLLIAPNRVNYHLEHHLLMTVPFYNLPRLHRLLTERGTLDGALVETGYRSILRQAASKPAPA